MFCRVYAGGHDGGVIGELERFGLDRGGLGELLDAEREPKRLQPGRRPNASGPHTPGGQAAVRWRWVRAARLPEPLFNVHVMGVEVDAVWPRHALMLEVDGYAFHGHRRAFERDRQRDAEAVAGGYRVIRMTWTQLNTEPYAVVATVARALDAPRRTQPRD